MSRKLVPLAAALLAASFAPPASAGPMPPAATLATSGQHTFVVRVDGTAWGWGSGVRILSSQMGDLGRGPVDQPVSASEPAPAVVLGATSVATGSLHTLVLAGGQVWAFGRNASGQLGEGTTTNRSMPALVGGLSGVKAIAAGDAHSLAVKSDGTVWAWGENEYGQLGDGTTTDRHLPVQVGGLSGVVAVAANTYSFGGFSVALRSDGTVWVWGGNSIGQLGIGSFADQHSPVQVPGLTNVTAIGTGWVHALAVRGDGTVWTWGYNFDGQLGDGTTTSRTTPVQALGVSNAVAVAGGHYHSIASMADGSVWGWGANWSGQLGDGTLIDRPVPGPSLVRAGTVAVAAGQDYSVAMTKGGSVLEWGESTPLVLGPVPLPKAGIVAGQEPQPSP